MAGGGSGVGGKISLYFKFRGGGEPVEFPVKFAYSLRSTDTLLRKF